jgi:hypothetical protein
MVSQPTAISVPEGHELDCLVLEIVRTYRDPNFTFKFTDELAHSIQNKVADTEAQKALNLRIWLAQITKWKGAKYEEALCLANAIEFAIERLRPLIDIHLNKCATVWLRVHTGRGNEDISFDLVRDLSRSTILKTRWTVCAAQLEAALSLAEYSSIENNPSDATRTEAEGGSDYFKTKDWMRPPPESSSDTYLQVVGLSEPFLMMDLYWWTKLPFSSLMRLTVPVNDWDLRLGFRGFEAKAESMFTPLSRA